MSLKDYLKSNIIAKRQIRSEEPMSIEDMQTLFKGIKTEQKMKSAIRFIWNFIIGICSIVAAIFSVLTYLQ